METTRGEKVAGYALHVSKSDRAIKRGLQTNVRFRDAKRVSSRCNLVSRRADVTGILFWRFSPGCDIEWFLPQQSARLQPKRAV